MRRLLLATFTALGGAITLIVFGRTDGNAARAQGEQMPAGYREWPLISVAGIGAPVNDIRAKLGNEVAMKAYRAGTVPFPDGAIIARLAWKQTTDDATNESLRLAAQKQLGRVGKQSVVAQAFVAGPPINVQFMVKDSKKYASTGGWGFLQFNDGKLFTGEPPQTCFACHAPAKDRDFVFTRYAR